MTLTGGEKLLLLASKRDWAKIVAQLALAIDYCNLKEAVHSLGLECDAAGAARRGSRSQAGGRAVFQETKLTNEDNDQETVSTFDGYRRTNLFSLGRYRYTDFDLGGVGSVPADVYDSGSWLEATLHFPDGSTHHADGWRDGFGHVQWTWKD